ncbi:MAG: acyl-CoA dehydrogenase, partial [Lentisphaeria bacterium]|nr:acyl-CoA dehydrogenase [Lentisphaeria bacterium]NQZ70896.1 acyl-CoA dehydrogenase [Lentisphaeria bacterium]
ITLAAVSTVMGMAFKLYDPDNLIGDDKSPGITCALIPSDADGITLGRRHDPMGAPFYNCPINGEDVIISVDDIIGGADLAGQGWRMLMECLSAGRAISLPATGTGCSKLVSRTIGNYATVRRQFGISIGRFEGIDEAMAEIGGYTYMLDAARKYTCGAVDAGEKPSVVSAIAKYNFTEIARTIVNHGMDIMGGAAISRGPKNLLANQYASLPISITVEGANILTRTMIIFGQGMIRCHPFAQDEVNALENNDQKAFDKAFFGHIGFVVRNSFRAVVLSVTRGVLGGYSVSGPTAKYYRKITWASSIFAVLTDICMGAYGGGLKRKEKLTGRLADVVSGLYLATAILRRYEAEGRQKEALSFVLWGLEKNMHDVQIAIEGILKNIDIPVLGAILGGPVHWLVRTNAIATGPSDRLGSTITRALMTPGKFRDDLTEHCFMPETETDALHVLEEAFVLVKESEGIEKELKAAVASGKIPKGRMAAMIKSARKENIIPAERLDIIEKAMVLAVEAIQVDAYDIDDFNSNLLPKPL